MCVCVCVCINIYIYTYIHIFMCLNEYATNCKELIGESPGICS
jgi:hypothetical protein